MQKIQRYRIREFELPNGSSPYRTWLSELDASTKARVQARIFRFEDGNLGVVEPVGGGVFEAKFNFGAGYRVYFGMASGQLVLLLLGGNKKTQKRDIKQARLYWADWKGGN